MRKATLVKVAAQSILRNKLRTFLTMLGIVIGVAAVIVMVAVGYGAQASIEAQINSLGTNMIMVMPGASRQGGVNMGSGTFNRLTLADAQKLERESTLLSAVSPVVSTFGQVIGGTGNWRSRIDGVATEYQTIRDLRFESGTWFSESDQRTMRKVVVLGATVASTLFPDGDAVGQQVQIRNVPCLVVGVLASKGTNLLSDMDDIVLLPYTTAQVRLRGRSFLSQIVASTSTPQDIPAAQDEIRGIMRESHRLGESDDDDFTIGNQSDLADAANSTTRVMTLLLAAIASISLLVGGIGIMNIMLVSVTERTREIGIRMAIGARGSDVMTQFLIESVVISMLGGLIGVALGVGGASVVRVFTGISAVTPPAAIVLAVGFSAAIGIFFGFYPARQAAALNPIQALRYE
jgi:putative ABC transport system permease protein